eukprot:CAMPEP_0179719942 /NCGR_PEP_ID=MMETSP0938-20121108/3690_1 /TAXON_ID=548131 ORGANISM="Ostreococcus mediterraneus, Strain clade-D-RCC1107" /NCGR_SAMPLE_ID=MMETSP0938 /ASSEMBLY_ACC=CAM_ASM_000576 /LENGTH=61 /DNA_ID=CAMNT_0021593803 /DNA_START=438 /DNA_END=623 /DNA_ORIENTATION=-
MPINTSSSTPNSSVTLVAIHGFMTSSVTFVMSTFARSDSGTGLLVDAVFFAAYTARENGWR